MRRGQDPAGIITDRGIESTRAPLLHIEKWVGHSQHWSATDSVHMFEPDHSAQLKKSDDLDNVGAGLMRTASGSPSIVVGGDPLLCGTYRDYVEMNLLRFW